MFRGLLTIAGIGLLAAALVLAAGTFVRAQDDDDPFAGDAPAAAAPAQAAAPAANAVVPAGDSQPTETGKNYLVWMFSALGWIFAPVFILMSLTTVALVVMNFLSIRQKVLVPKELAEEFGELMDNKNFNGAYQLAKENDSLLGRVLAAGLHKIPNGYDKAVQAMQDVGQQETMRLEHQIGYLALIGNLAPMVGLFGTVTGMINSFQIIAAGGSAPSPQKLAEGIATALFTTMIGLAIALPSLAIYDILKNRLARFVLEIGVISDTYLGRFSSTSKK
ncbi:MAG: MotA/TolQ/ExbB proton channel family protein [Thermoguttaceae bacterium]|nr:MotA/TolQ/ExbB proton channel family protein [Thermoguttaceae bacterium]